MGNGCKSPLVTITITMVTTHRYNYHGDHYDYNGDQLCLIFASIIASDT